MILKRFGNRVHSVRPNFDSRAMTEIGFLRGDDLLLSADDFAGGYERIAGHELSASAEGDVQGDVEDAVLAQLLAQFEALEAEAGDGAVLLVENEQGRNAAKTVGRQQTVVVGHENRLRFSYTVEPPLIVGIYRRNAAG
jgi:hypothetical protein